MNIKKALIFFLAIALSSQVSAHSRWLLPSHYALSSDKGEWITLDATASNEVFNVDKALGLDLLRILKPGGKLDRASSHYTAHRKSVADYFIKENGTYKITLNSTPRYFSSYKVKDKRKRARVNKLELASIAPKNATNLQTTYGFARVETYITLNNPTENFGTDGMFLELIPTTHPSEIVEQEPVTFTFTYHGKNQAGVEIEITPEGARYRNNPETVKLKSNNKGEITFTPKQAGRYLLVAEYKQEATDKKLADKEQGVVFLTFEAQLQ